MHDLSKFVGGQCEIQTNLSKTDSRRTLRGDIKSVTLTATEIKVCFEWLAEWSFKDGGYWVMLDGPLEHSVELDKAPKISYPSSEPCMALIDLASKNQTLLIYAKNWKRKLEKAKIEAHQEQRDKLAEINSRLNTTASGSSHSDDV